MQTLVIASAGSVAAAVFTHMIWKGGAIIGAAITPIIVALVTETLKKPTQVITAVAPPVARARRRGPNGTEMTDVPRAGVGGAPMGPPPTSADTPLPGDPQRADEDRFGIWQADKRPWYDRLKGRPMKIALATGALAFLIGAFALTGAELVFGGSVGGGGDRVTILPGKQKKSDDKTDKTKTTTTETTEETKTAPADEEETPTVPEETQTVPTVPQEQAPQTVPTTPEQTPAPQTVPTTPAPAPGTE
ncbi:MAG TPA: hypothetical protein VN238_04850, partial [Solirubrobacteraceae bacterium]|nr:hypothetical protein [Solirubrobacteraceae bacterium]